MTAIECILVGIIIVLLGFLFGVTGSLLSNKRPTQDKFIDVGGYLVGAGIVIAVMSWLYYMGTLLL